MAKSEGVYAYEEHLRPDRRMTDLSFLMRITEQLCKIGKAHRMKLPLKDVRPIKHFFKADGSLDHANLDEMDGEWTRREVLTRYLLLSVVLDQGPDIEGVRILLADVINDLYEKEVRILHRPADFFRELGISIESILEKHKSVKSLRSTEWARVNKSDPNRYNLFFAQSQRGIVSTNVLDYAIHRWGVPLCAALLLEKDNERDRKTSRQPLVDFVEKWDSAEIMSEQLKDDERYGLGSAIGDKACHLFAKFYVTILRLAKSRAADPGWQDVSYEVPFDSNAGRVLFRTGFLLELAPLEFYKDVDVIQEGKGKKDTGYIRVTNLRGKKTQEPSLNDELILDYNSLVATSFKEGPGRQKVDIQRVPNLLIQRLNNAGNSYSVADFDDGLIHVGTRYCFNHKNPSCDLCPINSFCRGFNREKDLILKYTT